VESLLLAPVYLTEEHALPFRTFFEEHLQHRRADLLAKADKYLAPDAEKSVEERLLAALRAQEDAYAALEVAGHKIAAGETPDKSLDELLKHCAQSDIPLKHILHGMNASALCLSGGGIRSASFSLGILEGLSRFSRNEHFTAPNGLMDKLDYISTVSGGGYTCSWGMSWVYRRMAAARPYPLITQPFDLAAESIEIGLALCRGAQQFLPQPPNTGASWSVAFARQLGDLYEACSQASSNCKHALHTVQKVSKEDRAEPSPYAPRVANARHAVGHMTLVREAIHAHRRHHPPHLVTSIPAIENALISVSLELSRALTAIRTDCVPDWQTSYGEVISALAGKSAVTCGDPEPQTVRHLRSYTSFLAPALGLTVDSFTIAAIILRNLIVNWTMLVPALFVAVTLPQCSRFLMYAGLHWLPQRRGLGLAFIIMLLFLTSAVCAAVALPSHFKIEQLKRFRRVAIWLFLSGVLLGCWLLTVSWSPGTQLVQWSRWIPATWVPFLRHHLPADVRACFITAPIAFIAFGTLSLSIFLAYKQRITGRMVGRLRRKTAAAAMMAITAVVASIASSSLLELLQRVIFPYLLSPSIHSLHRYAHGQRLYIVFALPCVLTLMLITATLFCALLGVYEMEEDREWWVRCAGCFIIFQVLWIFAHGIALYGQGSYHRIIPGLIGLALGFGGSAIGFSGATVAGAAAIKTSQLTSTGKFLQKYSLLLPAVGTLAIGLICVGAVAVEETFRKAFFRFHEYPVTGGLRGSLIILAISATLTVLVNFAININLFSLHGMYRMRLMRAFLGASNVFRRPDPFTNFDPKDTPYETDLPCGPGVPLHIINTTLNLTGTHNTAWRQRRAECFTFSPIQAGCWRLGYIPAASYGGSHGVTLATAMAISGGAFNPNMGYQSSPIVSLLMTFFNLRLGYWLPNPRRPDPKFGFASRGIEFFTKSGPSFALQPLIEDALGLTDDTFRWIELTDGGHFEQLGLYEMVMRRVKRIIVVDAGADPNYQFEDLGNAIRKISIDLGIPIKFQPDMKMKPEVDPKHSYCAVADIDYGCVDHPPAGKTSEDMKGKLIFIKAGITGLEPADILQYSKTHAKFPHETNANEFFNESQFESYRHLGSYIIDCIAHKAPTPPPAGDPIDTFIEAGRTFWSNVGADQKPSSPTPQENSINPSKQS
jgi:hypothetical protein